MSSFVQSKDAHIIAGLCAFTALVIAVAQIIQHLRFYSEPVFQRYIVRIIFMVPMYALASFPSLIDSEHAIYYTTVRDCYEAWVIYNFMSLCLAYVGGPGAVEVKMAGYLLMPSWAMGTCCLPPLPVNGRFVRWTKQGALQFVLIKPVLAIVTVILYATGHYTEGDWSPNNGYLWITIIYNLTYSAALYALLLFYLGTHELLAPFKPLLKFILVKSVIFLTYWQGLLIAIGTSVGVVNNAEEGVDIQNWLICVESLPAAVFMLFAFPWAEYKVAGGNISGGNISHAISIRDVVTDTVHQFAPAYHDYVLYSDGTHATKASPPKTVRTRTFMAVGSESTQQAGHDSLLMGMELGGMSTWQRDAEGQGPPAPGHTPDAQADAASSWLGRAAEGGSSGAVGGSETPPRPRGSEDTDDGLAGPFTLSDHDTPPSLTKSKYLAAEVEDPFAACAEEEEAGGGAEGSKGGRRGRKQPAAPTFEDIALESPRPQ